MNMLNSNDAGLELVSTILLLEAIRSEHKSKITLKMVRVCHIFIQNLLTHVLRPQTMEREGKFNVTVLETFRNSNERPFPLPILN